MNVAELLGAICQYPPMVTDGTRVLLKSGGQWFDLVGVRFEPDKVFVVLDLKLLTDGSRAPDA